MMIMIVLVGGWGLVVGRREMGREGGRVFFSGREDGRRETPSLFFWDGRAQLPNLEESVTCVRLVLKMDHGHSVNTSLHTFFML